MTGDAYLRRFADQLLARLAREDWEENLVRAAVSEFSAVAGALVQFELIARDEAEKLLRELHRRSHARESLGSLAGSVQVRVREVLGAQTSGIPVQPIAQRSQVVAERPSLLKVIEIGRHVGELARFKLTCLTIDSWTSHFHVQCGLESSGDPTASQFSSFLGDTQWHVADDLDNGYLVVGQGSGKRGAAVFYFDTTLEPPIDLGATKLYFRLLYLEHTSVSWAVDL